MNKIEQLYLQYTQHPDSKTFDEIWVLTKNMVNPAKYFDTTRARTLDDFNQVTREALWKALQSYNPEGGSTLLSWIRMKMGQHLIKELKKITRDMRVYEEGISLNGEYIEGGGELSSYIDIPQFDGVEIPEELIQEVILAVRVKLQNQPLILQVFDLKIVWPDISRGTIHTIMGLSKPTLSKYFTKIRLLCVQTFRQKYYR